MQQYIDVMIKLKQRVLKNDNVTELNIPCGRNASTQA